jgi:signal transduction histidine kinase
MRLVDLLKRWGFELLVVGVVATNVGYYIVRGEIWLEGPGSGLRGGPSFLWGTRDGWFALVPLILLLRRRFPLAAPVSFLVIRYVATWLHGGAAAYGFPDWWTYIEALAATLGLVLPFWSLGSQNPLVRAALGGAIGLGFVVANAIVVVRPYIAHDLLIQNNPYGIAPDFIGDQTLIQWISSDVPAAAGTLVAAMIFRRARRLKEAEAAARGERGRIARELHDIVAHSVSVMTVQAGAARVLLEDDPESACEPLLAVERTGRQALEELRHLLGVLRADGGREALGPQPTLADVEALVEEMRRAGLPVEIALTGHQQPLAASTELAAYRILQEALTNALKHGGGWTRVILGYGADALELEVVNEGRLSPSTEGTGQGLVGMRERARLYGGELTAGPRAEGGFGVRVRLPLTPR